VTKAKGVPPGIFDPSHTNEYAKFVEVIQSIVSDQRDRLRITGPLWDLASLCIRLGRQAGSAEGYRRARNLYKKRRPTISELVHEEFRSTLEEMRRQRNVAAASVAGSPAHKALETTNDRLRHLVEVLRQEIDDALLLRDKLVGLVEETPDATAE